MNSASNSRFPNQYAFYREAAKVNEWPVLPGESLTHLYDAWRYSATTLKQIESSVSAALPELNAIATVVVAGSYGRMEAGKHSDFDFFVIANNGKVHKRKDELALQKKVWETIKSVGLVPPDENGIFTRVLTPEQFCDPAALGNLEYPRHVFGLRLQLLTDSQPVYNTDQFEALQRDIFKWYCQPGHSPFAISPLQYLVSDLKRYFHSFSVWHQFRMDKTFNDSWLMRQIKMNHSRLASYVSLLIYLLNVANEIDSKGNEKSFDDLAKDLTNRLKLTPVERLVELWPEELGDELKEFLQTYNKVSGTLNDEEIRNIIINTDPVYVSDRRYYRETSIGKNKMEELVTSAARIQQLLAACVACTIRKSSSTTAALGAL